MLLGHLQSQQQRRVQIRIRQPPQLLHAGEVAVGLHIVCYVNDFLQGGHVGPAGGVPPDGLADRRILAEHMLCHCRRRGRVEELGVGAEEIIDYNTISFTKTQLVRAAQGLGDIVQNTGPGRVLHVGAVDLGQLHRRLAAADDMVDPALIVELQALLLQLLEGQVFPVPVHAVEAQLVDSPVDLGVQISLRAAEDQQPPHRRRGHLQKIVGNKQGRFAVALLKGMGIVLQGGLVGVVPVRHDHLGQGADFLGMIPTVKGQQHISAHAEIELIPRVALLQGPQRLHGVAGAGPAELQIIHQGEGHVFRRQTQQLQPPRGVGGVGREDLVGRQIHRHKQQ